MFGKQIMQELDSLQSTLRFVSTVHLTQWFITDFSVCVLVYNEYIRGGYSTAPDKFNIIYYAQRTDTR